MLNLDEITEWVKQTKEREKIPPNWKLIVKDYSDGLITLVWAEKNINWFEKIKSRGHKVYGFAVSKSEMNIWIDWIKGTEMKGTENVLESDKEYIKMQHRRHCRFNLRRKR